MTILVTGGTGVIGTQILEQLKDSGAAVHALTRTPGQAHFPADVTPVKGDLTDIDSVHVGVGLAFKHRHVDDAFHAGVASDVERLQGLGQFIGCIGH
jgi:uncharacterized protein YbjT (DUF2867 family)